MLQKERSSVSSLSVVATEESEYNGPRNLNTEEGRHKIYSKHDEKTVYSSFQGQSRPGTSQRREDHGTNRRRI